MSFLGIFFGIGKYSQKHPLGETGCIITMVLIGGIASFTMLVQALISWERRRAITNLSFVSFQYRIYTLLGLAAGIPFIFWIIIFAGLKEADYIRIRIDPNSMETIEICNPGDVAFVGSNEILFSTCAFLLPAIFICFNYWPIWKEAVRMFKIRSLICPEQQMHSVRKKRQIRLAIIMSLSVLEFCIFYFPQFCFIVVTVFQRLTGSVTLASEFSTIGCVLWLLDSIINPLWTTMLWRQINNDDSQPSSQRRSTATNSARIWFSTRTFSLKR